MSNDQHKIMDLIKNRKYYESPFIGKRRWHALMRVLNAAVTTEKYVPYNPMGHNLIKSVMKNVDPKKIVNDQKPIYAEAYITYKMLQFGLKYYGEPVFEYDLSDDSEKSENVDFWRNFIKFGREVGTKVADRRITKLKSMLNPDTGEYIERPALTKTAVENISKTYVGHTKSTDFESRRSEFSISSSTTNAGEWTYARKSSYVDGIKVKDIIKRDSNSLGHDIVQFGDLPSFLGARSQRGKWGVVSNQEDIDAQQWLLQNYKLPEQAFINKFLQEIRYSETKARVIAACPSSWSYYYSALGFAWIQSEQMRKAPAQVHLGGPLAIKEYMLKAKRVIKLLEKIHGIIVRFYNADADSYDFTIIAQHARDFYRLADDRLVLQRDKFTEKQALVDALTRPILYLPKPLSIKSDVNQIKNSIKVLISKRTLRSGEPPTNHFGSSNMEIQSEKSRLATQPKWPIIRDFFEQHNISPIVTNGDDNGTYYVIDQSGSFKQDLENHTQDMETKNGLIFKDPTIKGEAHFFYNQFRLTYDNRFISPLTRIRLYHKETSQVERPAYVSVVDRLMNYEFRYDCKGIVEWIHTFELPYDDTRMGTIDRYTGKQISFDEFKRLLKAEAADGKNVQKRTLTELLFRGNPYDRRIVNSKGDIQWDWLEIQWTKMMKIVRTKSF